MLVPDSIEPFIGWRGWWVRAGILVSVHNPTRWEPGVPVRATHSPPIFLEIAVPRFEEHDEEVPRAGCTCGIHAVKSRELLREQFIWPGLPDVWGRVAMWGRVIKAERGYKAEFAYPSALWVREERLVGTLKPYGVPIFVEEEV